VDAYRKTVIAAAVALFVSAATAAVILSRLGHPSPSLPFTPAAQPRTGFGARPESWPARSGSQAELEFTHRDDLAGLDLTGQYAAELAATRDEPAAVLGEHQRLRRALASDEHPVVLLRSTDLAHPADDTGTWLTLALGDFADRAAVTAWCHTAGARHCVPRRLDPPR
jgi:hypothetical protein